MKYVAIVRRVLVPGVHKIAVIEDDQVRSIADLPAPDRVEIELDGFEDEPCMMYRYTAAGDCCGDTWHQCFEDAIHQANREYGLNRADFSPA